MLALADDQKTHESTHFHVKPEQGSFLITALHGLLSVASMVFSLLISSRNTMKKENPQNFGKCL